MSIGTYGLIVGVVSVSARGHTVRDVSKRKPVTDQWTRQLEVTQ